MANALLTALRDTGERLLEAELPTAQELPALLGGLIVHLEQHFEHLAEVELEKVAGLKEPPASPAPAQPAQPPAPVQATGTGPIGEPVSQPTPNIPPPGQEPAPPPASEPAPATAPGESQPAAPPGVVTAVGVEPVPAPPTGDESARERTQDERIIQLEQELAVARAQNPPAVAAEPGEGEPVTGADTAPAAGPTGEQGPTGEPAP